MLNAAPGRAKPTPTSSEIRVPSTAIARQKQRHQGRARRLAQQPRRPQHAARAAAALARGGRDHGAVVGRLEQAEARAASAMRQTMSSGRGAGRQPRQRAEPAGEQQKSDATQQAGRVAFDQPPGERRRERDGDRPGRDQKPDLDRRIAERLSR